MSLAQTCSFELVYLNGRFRGDDRGSCVSSSFKSQKQQMIVDILEMIHDHDGGRFHIVLETKPCTYKFFLYDFQQRKDRPI
eukprot:scaffold229_cov136-Cylindrotheca_fusiformis.AAC.8